MIRRILGESKRYLLNLVDEPTVILLYHRVTHLNRDPQLLSVSPENFYDQLKLLREKYNLLRIEEFSEIIDAKKKLPKNAVILTFDDGYADNIHEAVPILESFNSQALFYITTSQIGTDKELWWDELERIFLEDHSAFPKSIQCKTTEKSYHFSTGTREDRTDTYNSLHPIIKWSTVEERNRLISELLSQANLGSSGRTTHRLMTKNELIRMNESNAAIIGAHTHNHPALSTLSYEEQTAEISNSKAYLEELLDKKIEYFSYPFGGRSDYNNDSVKVCRENAFKFVCSNFHNQVHSWTDKYQMPRMLVRNWNKELFANQLAKFFKS